MVSLEILTCHFVSLTLRWNSLCLPVLLFLEILTCHFVSLTLRRNSPCAPVMVSLEILTCHFVSLTLRWNSLCLPVLLFLEIFQPSLANKKSIGIPELIYNSIMKCDKNVRAELLANITLSGGNTKFSGMEKRIYQELESLLPVASLKQALKVRALPHRDLLGWVGAARLSQLSSFQRFWVTPADYREDGSSVTLRSSRLFEDLRNSNASLPTTTV